MKRFLCAAAVGLAAAALVFILLGARTPSPQPEGPPASALAAQPTGTSPAARPAPGAPTFSRLKPPGTPGPAPVAAPAVAPAADARLAQPPLPAVPPLAPPVPGPNDLPPEIVLQNLRRSVRLYGQQFGGNPVGTNPEITAALAGNNPKQVNFLRGQPGFRINERGELVDTWGTPYFFHQLSANVMEIHSAGPDRIMWTSDDLVTQ
jgi:hypothetical protein